MARKICSYPNCVDIVNTEALCKGHLLQKRRGHQLKPKRIQRPRNLTLEESFKWGLSKAIFTDSGCVLWPSRRKGNKYGRFRAEGKEVLAHRIAYMLEYGPLPADIAVHHTCHNDLCVNIAHLQKASSLENALEMMERKALLSRIGQLEHALRAIDPHHQLLR